MEGGYTDRDIKQPIFLTEPQGNIENYAQILLELT